ncbi:MAG: aminopeptidase [Eubacteriaceae bacterium]|nr:aminopeptidase [Eubacteriaceae bacterium]
MDTERLRSYARLIARKGLNIQSGQEVIIQCEPDQTDFICILTEECYLAGAGRVIVDMGMQELTKLHVKYRSLEDLSTLSDWEEARYIHYTKSLPCRIRIMSEDPDGLRDMDQGKLARSRQELYRVTKKYTDEIENRYQWCIAAVPGKAWAKKIYPSLTEDEAVEKLWDDILYTSRVTDDPLSAWDEHNRELEARCRYLNSLDIVRLRYSSSNGTDFCVGMIDEAEFKGGGEYSLQNIFFDPNIPTEEVFISPKRGEAEGIVYATKPLSYQGQLIETFSVRFEHGKAVEVTAEKNRELLETIISMDEGAAYLGECALVPHDSPISNSGILFYNTLFDENASCHLALGRGFADSLKDYSRYSLEEARELGINDSMIHVDFMIGSADLSIDAELRDGSTVAVFRGGNWAFDI